MRANEIIYHLSKGDNIYLNDKCNIKDPLTSVWYIPHNIKERIHPTQMPKNVVRRILEISSQEGDIILDSFMGSGTTCKVAKEMNRNYIGIEINPIYYKLAKKRINKSSSLNKFLKEN